MSNDGLSLEFSHSQEQILCLKMPLHCLRCLSSTTATSVLSKDFAQWVAWSGWIPIPTLASAMIVGSPCLCFMLKYHSQSKTYLRRSSKETKDSLLKMATDGAPILFTPLDNDSANFGVRGFLNNLSSS